MKKEISFFEKAFSSFTTQRIVGLVKNWRRFLPTMATKATALDPELPPDQEPLIIAQMKACLEAKGGEISGRKNTVELGQQYLTLSESGKQRFLQIFTHTFGIDKDQLMQVIKSHVKDGLGYEFEIDVNRVVQSPRCKILKQFLSFEEGLKFLIDMRRDALKALQSDPSLRVLEADLHFLLTTWLDVGMLDLRQITWDSPASLLEKLILYEAVHRIDSWQDLRNRLDSDRLCFAFFHHKMPTEPLIFVEVALTADLSSNIHALLDEEQPLEINTNTAIFYSISNTQPGLAKISLGNFLIKRVVEHISVELPPIKVFATLSPIPNFLNWLAALLKGENQGKTAISLSDAQKESLSELLQNASAEALRNFQEKETLMALCAYYLVMVKHNKKVTDPVANFHLSNGAMIRRLNWEANTSSRGIKESLGIMVNYLYEPDKIENRHEHYMAHGTISTAREVSNLIKSLKLA